MAILMPDAWAPKAACQQAAMIVEFMIEIVSIERRWTPHLVKFIEWTADLLHWIEFQYHSMQAESVKQIFI